MNKQIARPFFLLFSLIFILTSAAWAQQQYDTTAWTFNDLPFDVVILFPGDSKSIEFEYNGVAFDPEAFHLALVGIVSPVNKIRELTINITTLGNQGTEIGYITTGFFIGSSFESLVPRFSYGSEDVTYSVNVGGNALGVIISAVVVEFTHFDFPLKMTMTLTLSN